MICFIIILFLHSKSINPSENICKQLDPDQGTSRNSVVISIQTVCGSKSLSLYRDKQRRPSLGVIIKLRVSSNNLFQKIRFDPFIDIPMLYLKYLTMHHEQLHAGAMRKLLMVCASVRETIHSLSSWVIFSYRRTNCDTIINLHE